MELLSAFSSWLRVNLGKRSFAQCGEDLIVDFVLQQMGIRMPSYLDIGSHHPLWLNNTYLFYRRGGRGVCVEPNPRLHAKLVSRRGKDTCLNVGIGTETETSATFYVMQPDTLSTFSREVAERYESEEGVTIEVTMPIPVYPLDHIVKNYFSSTPNVISLDTEGTEYQILERFDFDSFRPQVFLVETLKYTHERIMTKDSAIRDLMDIRGYFLYADTWINSIFVEKKSYEKMK